MLRALRPTAVDLAPDGVAHLDPAHLAAEIARLGAPRPARGDVRPPPRHQHLVEWQASPKSRDAAHRDAETVDVQLAAYEAFSPGLRRLIDIDAIRIGGCRAAGRVLKDAGARDPSTDPCPFTLDDLLARDFDVDAAVGRIGVG